MVITLTNCRVCKEELSYEDVVVNLGDLYPSGFNKSNEDLSEDIKAPLVLCKCKACGLVQLMHTVDLDLMYRQYWYSSSLNKSMVTSLQNVVDDVLSKVELNHMDTIVDIGCNDGTMLNLYPKNVDLNLVGYDPALNLKRPDGIYFYNDYFSLDGYFDKYGHTKAKIVTAIAMFYDLPDPIKFSKDVASILHKDGVFVIQFTDLLSMFNVNAFDNICHEHLEYYTLKNVQYILGQAGLEIVDVTYNDVNGGSVRVSAKHSEESVEISPNVINSLHIESTYFNSITFEDFKENIARTIQSTRLFLDWCKEMNYTVHLLGASTKGNTYLQLCGITNKDIPYAAEVNKDKFGMRTIGSNIYIIPEDESLALKPDCYLVPVWHFKESLLKNDKIKSYLENGGTLVFPLPHFTTVTKFGETVYE